MHGDSPVHRLPPEVKLVGLLVFVGSVVALPRDAFWAYFLAACLLAGVVILAGIPARTVAMRLLIEVPFLFFAILLPFISHGEQVSVLGISLSVEGLWGAWTILAKGTLGVSASIVLAATTPAPELIRGLDRIRVPRVLTAIISLMIRYLDIVVEEFSRRSIAMASRGYRPRWFWQVGPMAVSAGSLFIRSFERGERLHQAMVARGFNGRMPSFGEPVATGAEWLAGLAVPAVVTVMAVLAGTVL
ncbi:MAG: cobalt ECF transporter T component CbiQ [Acidimicrobiia bacterium]